MLDIADNRDSDLTDRQCHVERSSTRSLKIALKYVEILHFVQNDIVIMDDCEMEQT
jgi:hypothetical protein